MTSIDVSKNLTAKNLTDNWHLLLRTIDPTPAFIDSLSSLSTFDDADLDSIESKETPDAKNARLLRLLLKEGPSAVVAVATLLENLDQEHAAGLLSGNQSSDKRPMSDENYKLLGDKMHQLRKFLNPLGGLIGTLREARIFQERDEDRVSSKTVMDDKAGEVVKILMRKWDSAFCIFIDALCVNEQEHVASILTGKGEEPLLDYHLKLLRAKRSILTSNILLFPGDDLLSKMIAKHVFSSHEGQLIRAEKVLNASIECFLDLLERKSRSAFDKFIEALRETDQDHVGAELEKLINGYIVPTFTQQKSEEENKSCDKYMTQELNKENKFTETLNRDNILVYATQGSIAVHFTCLTESAVNVLEHKYNESELVKLFSESFHGVFEKEGIKFCYLTIDAFEFERCRNSFKTSKLMTSQNRSALNYALDCLCDKIEVSENLLRRLKIARALKGYVAQFEKNQSAHVLLDIVSRQPDHLFDEFMEALDSTNQGEVATEIRIRAKRMNSVDLGLVPLRHIFAVENDMEFLSGAIDCFVVSQECPTGECTSLFILGIGIFHLMQFIN
jgi:Caspase recruitment domain